MSQPPVRRIRPGEGALLRVIRLRALAEDPHAFASSYQREVDRPPEAWETWAASAAAGNDQSVFVAESTAGFVGMAGAFRLESDPRALRLIAMWTAPEVRGRGVGSALTDAVVAWARAADADTLTLWVVDGNDAARRTYEAAGFVPTALREPVGDGTDRMQTLMQLDLGDGVLRLPPGYVEFAPMTPVEFDAWLEWFLASHAADLMEAEKIGREAATNKARSEIIGLLPAAEATPAMHLATMRVGVDLNTVGWIWFGPRDTPRGRRCVLYDIVVFDAHRDRGIGSAALDELEEWATIQGLAAIEVDVFEHNSGVGRFFERLGYEVARTAAGRISLVKML